MVGALLDGREALKGILLEILDPAKELGELVPQAEALRDLLERLSGFSPNGEGDIGEGQTRLNSGLAISPALAAMCLRELYRTLAFIRGSHEAVCELLAPERPIRVLYAGCGPYALLALPLMAVLTPLQVRFTLMDIHQECLDQAAAMISAFGFADHVDEFLCVDATRYRIPDDKKPDVIISETMAVCLRNEPQVSVFRHLLSQVPDARLVPQSVSVELAMLIWSKEHVLMPADYVGDFPPPARDRLILGTVFRLDADHIHTWAGIGEDHLPGGMVTILSPLESCYRPALLTRIVVHGRHRLEDYDCSLTMPQHLPGRTPFKGGETLRFHYKLGNYPKLVHEVLS